MTAIKATIIIGVFGSVLAQAQIMPATSASDLKIVADLLGGGVRYRSMIGRLERAEFTRLATDFLGDPSVRLGAVALYGSSNDHALAGPLGYSHCGYESWRALIDGHDVVREGCPEVREAIKIGENIVIRSQDRTCRRNLNLVQGKTNPLNLAGADGLFELLEVSFSRPMGKQNDDRITADLFVRTRGIISKGAAQAITVQVKSLTGAKYLGVILRSDTWFLGNCQFPALYPFEERPRIPTKEEFSRMKEVGCFASDQWPIRCIDFRP